MARSPAGPVSLRLPSGPVFVLDESPEGARYVLPSDSTRAPLEGGGRCWVLPDSPFSELPGWEITTDGRVSVRFEGEACVVVAHSGNASLKAHRARPHTDAQGASFVLNFEGGTELADAFAGFYWGTLLPCVIERTAATGYPDPEATSSPRSPTSTSAPIRTSITSSRSRAGSPSAVRSTSTWCAG